MEFQRLGGPVTALFILLGGLVALVTGSVPGLAHSSRGSVTVDGASLMFDGKPFIARGVIFEGFLNVPAPLRGCRHTSRYCADHLEAYEFYFGRGKYRGNSGLDIARQWGANTVRLNLNQAALDPANEFFSPQYIDEVVSAVARARSYGFVVIAALFDGRNTNMGPDLLARNPRTPLDNEVTLRAASLLARQFGQDRGVMLELLNEPFSPTRRRFGWRIWRDGGVVTQGRYAGRRFVGVNAVIAAIRAQGAQNVIILQGLMLSFKGFPGGVRDPLGQVAYSVHPFFRDGHPGDVDWDGHFGNFAKQHPFLITAWGIDQSTSWCMSLGPHKPRQFLDYVRDKKIGLVFYAMDVKYKLLRNFRQSRTQFTSLANRCINRGGIGELARQYLRAGQGAQ